MSSFDVLIVGGGHAGIEAAYLASQFNLQIGLISIPGIGLASAPCNPSVGGVGKGQVVREIDALGGAMGILTDKAGIQFRTLNDSKGYAVQSSRVQIDKELYSQEAEKLISSIPNITIIREKINSIQKNDLFEVIGINKYYAKKIILTVGTFLNGKLHTGSKQASGGRVDCDVSPGLSDLLGRVKVRPQRFKTGTPPRLNKSTVDYSKLEEQPSDSSVRNFHCLNKPFLRYSPQVSCYLAHTNKTTMDIIRENKEKSPMFNGQITGVGARYCPSIEDKAFRYPDKNTHHVFIEPEGLNLNTVYPSGISSSLPEDVQLLYVHSIPGLENAEIEQFGYAVEYDVVDTTELKQTLEHSQLDGLYFAGQVNGTSGYEEAAGQGLVAGINAALSILEREAFILSRHESYIGVMIEDLVSNTRDEPYRLFTARSENRLYIREDNSLVRMWPYRTKLDLNHKIDTYLNEFMSQFQVMCEFCDNTMISEGSPFMKEFSGVGELQNLSRRMSLSELLRQAWLDPVKTLERVLNYHGLESDYDLSRAVAITKKYEGYIKRSESQVEKLKKMDSMKINWREISTSQNVSYECRQRIIRVMPETFGQLKLIDGIRPATLAVVAAKAL
jgi:tRNA uridine 5-carboxymethylaminomethyl modification enzyme